MFSIPIWVFVVILLIFLSGVMAYRAMRKEHKIEQNYIEREGSIYIDRMETERLNRTHENEQISE